MQIRLTRTGTAHDVYACHDIIMNTRARIDRCDDGQRLLDRARRADEPLHQAVERRELLAIYRGDCTAPTSNQGRSTRVDLASELLPFLRRGSLGNIEI